MYLRISCYCDACLNSSDLRVGVTTLLNTIQYNSTHPRKTFVYVDYFQGPSNCFFTSN